MSKPYHKHVRSFDAMPFPQCALYQFPLVSCWKFEYAVQVPLALFRCWCIVMHLPRHVATRLFPEPEGYEGKSNDNIGNTNRIEKKQRFTYTKTLFFRDKPFFLINS